MKNYLGSFTVLYMMLLSINSSAQGINKDFPETQISNQWITMKLYLPDPEKGSYRATRFDWSGIISSVKYKGHEYFGYWKKTHDPLIHEDLSGPVESYNDPGLGYEEASPGGYFIRIGVGILEKPEEKGYETFKTYRIVDFGNWTVTKGEDWIQFEHEIKSDIGYGYLYTKRIELKTQEPGFTISHHLLNTGNKKIETDQYNHNFFIIDGEKSGPAIHVQFPFDISTENDLKGLMQIEENSLKFLKNLNEQTIWMELSGYSREIQDHRITVKNNRTGAGVRFGVDKPLYRMVFWACNTTYCPENFILLSVDPGKKETWTSDYTLFTE